MPACALVLRRGDGSEHQHFRAFFSRDEGQLCVVLHHEARASSELLPPGIDRAGPDMGETIDAVRTNLQFAGGGQRDGLAQALLSERPLAWTEPATAPHARLTLTLPTLLAARCLVLPLAGAAKRAVFEQACAAPTADLPISLVLHQAARPVHVWQAP